jgi:ABC-type uncharacterized transport system involved in gliding motility auxiliary subunit
MQSNRKIYPRLALVLLVAGFIALSALNSLLFGRARIDLTEGSLYTISDGTREILAAIDEPIDLYLFYSDKATRELAPLRTYARRVREVLEEYAREADGRIRLKVIDPEPFSEAEDQAAEFGLQAVPLDAGGEKIYLGLAASNAVGERQVIPFFQPEREEFLEYELSKLVSALTATKKPVVGLVSGLQIAGGFDMMSSQPTPPWMVVDQIRQGVELKTISPQADSIDPEVTTLMVVHPAGLGEGMLYAIDQFVLKGGKALVFVDPYCESARATQNPMMGEGPGQSASTLAPLFGAWGVDYAMDKIVADPATALQINFAPDQPPVPHLAFLGLGPSNTSRSDVVTAQLESINLGMAGALSAAKDASTRFEPLLQSSDRAGLIDSIRVQVSRDPSALQKDFKPGGQRYTLAARISGPAKSAFPGPREEGVEHLASADNINVLVVADADMLADRFWVQVQDFFGQRIASAWADNAAFAQNAVENLSGSSALIDVRGRGRFSRPFERVQDIRLAAEARYQSSADELQRRLDETEQRLEELQKSKEEGGQLVLSPEQEQALLDFQDEKLRIRKELRDVRHQMDREIESLGAALKVLNIVAAPLLLTLLLFGWHRWRESARRRAHGAASS